MNDDEEIEVFNSGESREKSKEEGRHFEEREVSYLVAHQLAYPYLRGLGIANTKLGIPDILRCSFLRNINEPAHFSFVSPLAFPMPMHGAKCPIFEDGPNFDMAFRVFHGRDGVVPLSGRSYRVVSHVIPITAKALQPPPSMKFRCLPVVVAARAALAQTDIVKNLRPQPLPAKMLVIGVLGMATSVSLRIWREHTEKFSHS
ncbi:hypothetical protein CK203_038463 [Vitis vinifera]|uniref:Uncharacterized protein n=1 Tax=Vitis vinifera TaxID=29760 RepID=A0A438IRV8_VITVI|nr:hypothetical protein CK203_038463 [Vitis vinifera]